MAVFSGILRLFLSSLATAIRSAIGIAKAPMAKAEAASASYAALAALSQLNKLQYAPLLLLRSSMTLLLTSLTLCNHSCRRVGGRQPTRAHPAPSHEPHETSTTSPVAEVPVDSPVDSSAPDAAHDSDTPSPWTFVAHDIIDDDTVAWSDSPKPVFDNSLFYGGDYNTGLAPSDPRDYTFGDLDHFKPLPQPRAQLAQQHLDQFERTELDGTLEQLVGLAPARLAPQAQPPQELYSHQQQQYGRPDIDQICRSLDLNGMFSHTACLPLPPRKDERRDSDEFSLDVKRILEQMNVASHFDHRCVTLALALTSHTSNHVHSLDSATVTGNAAFGLGDGNSVEDDGELDIQLGVDDETHIYVSVLGHIAAELEGTNEVNTENDLSDSVAAVLVPSPPPTPPASVARNLCLPSSSTSGPQAAQRDNWLAQCVENDACLSVLTGLMDELDGTYEPNRDDDLIDSAAQELVPSLSPKLERPRPAILVASLLKQREQTSTLWDVPASPPPTADSSTSLRTPSPAPSSAPSTTSSSSSGSGASTPLTMPSTPTSSKRALSDEDDDDEAVITFKRLHLDFSPIKRE